MPENRALSSIFDAVSVIMSDTRGFNVATNSLTGTIPTTITSLAGLTYDQEQAILGMFNRRWPGFVVCPMRCMLAIGYCHTGQAVLHLFKWHHGVDSSWNRQLNSPSVRALVAALCRRVAQCLRPTACCGCTVEFRYIDFNSNILSGSLPSTISGLQSLSYLNIYNNTISGSIPNGINAFAGVT